MTVSEFSQIDSIKPLVICDGDREIEGVYIGDLLSWVMGNASSGDAWITIMSNINILAVASLSDTACIILAEGVTLSEDIVSTAKEKNINVLSSGLTIYETALLLNDLL